LPSMMHNRGAFVDDHQRARNLRPAHVEVGCEGEVS